MPHTWKVLKGSVRGAAHIRSGMCNQDAIFSCAGGETGSWTVLAVSDGHGSPKCFRSDVGARIAVEIATASCLELLDELSARPLATITEVSQTKLPREIVIAWRTAVMEHQEANPFSAEELNLLQPKATSRSLAAALSGTMEPPIAPEVPIEQVLLTYGATLLLAAVGNGFVFYLQLGDGDILAVSEHAEPVEHPIPPDDTMMANETTSLCMPSAHKLFRYRFQNTQSGPPALILLATDGYSNSFTTPADFDKVGSDLLTIAKTQGAVFIEENLTTWLDKASTAGSGDDVTVGIICRADVIAANLLPAETPSCISTASAAATATAKETSIPTTQQGEDAVK